jgi:hypothetical protein
MPDMPDSHPAEIRRWLSRNGYRKLDLPKDQPEHWFRGRRGVRFTWLGDRCKIAVLHVTDDRGWVDLDELLGRPGNWNQAVALVTELAGTPAFRRAPGDWLYGKARPWAHGVKVVLQMLVGIGAVADIAWHVTHSISRHTGTSPFAPRVMTSVTVIASALAVAAAIELAYTLFTPGPDEALDPLMLGLSSGILVLITGGAHLSPAVQFSAVLLGVLALGALFLIRRRLLDEDDG